MVVSTGAPPHPDHEHGSRRAANAQVKHIGNETLTDVAFLPRGLLTASKGGQIKFWIRPLAVQPRHLRTHSTLRRGSQTEASG